MTQVQGFPRPFLDRVVDTQRATQVYRGVRPATQWMYIDRGRRGNLGYLDFENGWGDGDPDAPAQFCMDENGRVRLRGRIAGGAVGTSFVTLPPGFRPPVPQSFVLSNADSGYANVELGTDGAAVVTGITAG
jgi:hypothetical protein